MRLITLRISNLRNILELELTPGPGFTVLVGPNGSGKTSILEAAYLLSHAQSFRVGGFETLVRRSAAEFALHARVERLNGSIQVGLARGPDGWEARVNNGPVATLAELLSEFALVCLEPGSHALISGGSSERRRFLDWGVFHVEPEHLRQVRSYRRALQQRNAALKQGNRSQLDAWDHELVRSGVPLAQSRSRYFAHFATVGAELLQTLLPELGVPHLQLGRGWPDAAALEEILSQSRTSDLARGHTTRGPHRADWSLAFENAPAREYLSRGQQKLCALACVLAQARMFALARGEWPVIALDDLASELDAEHQRYVVRLLADAGAQVLVTGTEIPGSLAAAGERAVMFHVEHGTIRSLL